MTRDELIRDTRALVEEGDRLTREPTLVELRGWLRRSDALLSTAWGSMDGARHEARLFGDEEAAYVSAVAEQKTAALRMSLHAIEDQGMPFRGETTVDAGPTGRTTS